MSAAREDTILFLFNFSTREMHGIFKASGPAGFPLHPRAWLPGVWSDKLQAETEPPRNKPSGVTMFLAQLPVERIGPPLPALSERGFRSLMEYEGSSNKFGLTLGGRQVEGLVTLFVEAARASR